MYFASGAFDPLQWTSVVSFSRRWADKSPEPVMWFHYSVIILYSSSRPTPLSSARNDNKSNQQECSSLREKQHKQRVREKKTFFISLVTFYCICFFVASHVIFMPSCLRMFRFYHLDLLSLLLLLLFYFFLLFFFLRSRKKILVCLSGWIF